MKNLELTRWLKLVWDALAEKDEVKRNDMLQNATVFLNEGDEPSVFDTSDVIEEKTAA